MKKILIISSGYPSNGGQASTAYNLNALLTKSNYDVKIIFLKNSLEYGNIDPKLIKNSHKLNYAKSLQFPITRTIVKFIISLKIFKITGINSFSKYLYKKLQNILIKKEIYGFLKKNKFKPDLAITNTPILYENFYKLFEKTLIIIGSAIFFWKIGEKGIDYQTIKQNPKVLNNKKDKYKILGLNQSHLIFNSQLTNDFFQLNGVNPKNKKVQYFNIPPNIISSQKDSFDEKKYDIGVIVSNFNRLNKGIKKADSLFHYFAEQNKIAIGKNSSIFNAHLNCTTFDLMSQKNLAKYLSEIKLVIIPSLFDPSPSILSEAVLNGCNVLCSKNIGWHEYINDNCVVLNYHNNDEWINKIKLLLDQKIENKKFLQLISNSKEKMLETINDIIN
tara:strand:- start:1500 stop:2666 length:1167 start_codon:yes stop_codon:yes gene_type:complete